MNRQHYDVHESKGPARVGTGELRNASLDKLCDLVVTGQYPYSDLAERIENKAYDEWRSGNFDRAVEDLKRVVSFFERLENKSEENTRDLAGVYLLIGQLYQYAEWHPESIEWFSKSIFADDGYSLSYHCMAQSYLKTGNVYNAIRCFEQELVLDEGNYFTYLQLADLYGREGKLEKAEESLKNLLGRDPENIQGLHQLIRHYEMHNPAVNTGLLRKRLLGVRKKFTWAEAVIRSRHLCAGNRAVEALDFLSAWQTENHPVAEVHLARAGILGELKRFGDRKNEMDAFRKLCRSRARVMKEHLVEFGRLAGEKAVQAVVETVDENGCQHAKK